MSRRRLARWRSRRAARPADIARVPDRPAMRRALRGGAGTAAARAGKALAKQRLETGVRAHVVAPGPFRMPLQASGGQPTETVMRFGDESRSGRPGQPVELAPVDALLASQEASDSTGAVYGVTGGRGRRDRVRP